jgi:L-asparaginase
MRPSSGLSTDGDLNVVNAIRVAADPAAAGRGALVVLNDTIWAGRDVTKTSTYRLQSFQAPDAGPLGFADADGRVFWTHRVEQPHTTATEFDVGAQETLPRVDVVVSYVGADGALIDAAVAAGAAGIVAASTGAGRPTPLEDEALDRAAAAGVVVCQSSRVGSGRVVYAPALQHRGFVAAGNLRPWKAKILLQLALTKTREPAEIHRMLETY